MSSPLEHRDLRTLLRISMAMHSVQALYAARDSGAKELLEGQLLELIFESVPAERGAIVLRSDVTELPGEIAGYCRATGPSPIPVNRAIVERVLQHGEAIQIDNPPESGIGCLMAIPLTSGDKVQGVIYLDCFERGSVFTEEQLELMTAIASIAAMALESEFFGYEKGSFTGAFSQKKGKLEVADGGTVFLDEIGELAPQLQAKLLRVLQERCFERVGGTRSIPVSLRVIAATNRDLPSASRVAQRIDIENSLRHMQLKAVPRRGNVLLASDNAQQQDVNDRTDSRRKSCPVAQVEGARSRQRVNCPSIFLP